MNASQPAPTRAPRPARAWPVLSQRTAGVVVSLWTLVLVLVNLFAHPTPLYTVETDLVGEYLPAASELLRGVLDTSHYAFKGPGYPLVLAGLAWPLHGEVALAARVLSPLAAGLSAWLAFLLVRFAVSEAVATFTLVALLAAPTFVCHAVEAGTDAPALALMLGSMLLVLRPGGTRARIVAGLLAGAAVLTRGNAVFLLPCALVVLAMEPARVRSLALYAIGAALPLLAWQWIAARAGGLPPDRNHLNVAWELYGRGVPWEQFEANIGSRFHSLADVLRYDPPAAAWHVLQNLFVHRWLDARELIVPWLAVPALPGLVLLAREGRARGWLLHGLGAALVLAPVFYSARFALVLLPLELAAAGLVLAWLAERAVAFAESRGAAARTSRLAFGSLVAGLLTVSLAVAAADTTRALAQAPHETRLAGAALARLGLHGERILARKPHVAYFAGMSFVPLPLSPALAHLPRDARAAGARYLFFSGIEQVMRPNFAVLGDSGLSLPGFEQLLWGRAGGERFYAVYRLQDAVPDSAAFDQAYRAALSDHERRHPGSAEALLFVAAQYLALGSPLEALARLDRLERAGAENAAVERYRSTALLATNDLERAARACTRAMELEPVVAWHWGRLGEIRARQGRFGEAREAFTKAVELEPASLEYLVPLARVQLFLRDFPGAATAFERCIRLAPRDAALRRYAISAWRLSGDEARARRIRDEGVSAGIAPAALEGDPLAGH